MPSDKVRKQALADARDEDVRRAFISKGGKSIPPIRRAEAFQWQGRQFTLRKGTGKIIEHTSEGAAFVPEIVYTRLGLKSPS